jgi:hypothetical protein
MSDAPDHNKGVIWAMVIVTFVMVVVPVLAVSITKQGRATCHLNYITPCFGTSTP